jgi:hypothetical protein
MLAVYTGTTMPRPIEYETPRDDVGKGLTESVGVPYGAGVWLGFGYFATILSLAGEVSTSSIGALICFVGVGGFILSCVAVLSLSLCFVMRGIPLKRRFARYPSARRSVWCGIAHAVVIAGTTAVTSGVVERNAINAAVWTSFLTTMCAGGWVCSKILRPTIA